MPEAPHYQATHRRFLSHPYLAGLGRANSRSFLVVSLSSVAGVGAAGHGRGHNGAPRRNSGAPSCAA
jgi:hypothetical protein